MILEKILISSVVIVIKIAPIDIEINPKDECNYIFGFSENKEKINIIRYSLIENISKLLIRIMLILIPIVFLLNVWKHDIIVSFTFAVAIAICITPLLLPVILSSSLSKGALRMSKKKTIVKKLDSIQSFGAMNILCTDKTGTLTEDKIVLEKYLDIMGNEDLRVLKHAFLNSYFQTGLRSNIDEAVINRGFENGRKEKTEKYTNCFHFADCVLPAAFSVNCRTR